MTKETATATAPQISGLSGVAPRASASGPLIRRLLSYLVTENLPAGSHLTEQGLADTLGVSRTPIRKALTELLAEGVVRKEAHRGYFLAKPAHDLFAASLDFDSVDEDTLFERIATDHLSGIIPDAFSERDVASHYGVSLRLAQRAIGNLSEENVIRQTEQGTWEFNPFLLTQEAYQASYTLPAGDRAANPAAALLQPAPGPHPQLPGRASALALLARQRAHWACCLQGGCGLSRNYRHLRRQSVLPGRRRAA